MNLEVISRKPKGKTRATPLLFVHGAYGGAWIWDQHFLPYFAENGYAAHALSLRGHGESAGWEGVGVARLWQYVADLRQVAADPRCTAGADRSLHGRHGGSEVHS